MDFALNSIDWNFVTSHLSAQATCDISRSLLQNLSPCSSELEAQESMQNIAYAQAILKKGIRPQMQSLDLFESWHQRLIKDAVLKTLELRDVRRFCHEVLSLNHVLENNYSPWSKKLRDQLMDAQSALSAIDHLISPDGEIRTDASETLFTLFSEKKQKALQISQILDSLVKKHQMEPLLQDRYVTTREGRWVLPIKSGMQHSFNGIIHATSQSKQTVFMEPNEIVPLNNRLREIDDLIENEVQRLLKQLSDYLRSFGGEWVKSKNAMIEADIGLAKAELANQLEAQPCSFSKDQIVLNQVRHPVLVLNQEKVIANSVGLDEHKRLLLLSGPNAGGKTVLLKSIGLAAHMARCGLLICARADSSLPFFKNLHIIVGDAQNVNLHLSTFAAHLESLKAAAVAKGPDSLLLIDEICGSTDPEEGSALARAFIETFASQGVFGVITSHLGPLKLGWDKNSPVLNGSLESDAISGLPTYRFIPGIAGQSLALQTAKRVGVDKAILDRATSFMSPQSKLHHKATEQMQTLKENLVRTQSELEKELKQVLTLKSTYQNLISKFRGERQQWLAKTMEQAQRKIDELIAQAKVSQIFERHEKLVSLKKELPQIVGYSNLSTDGFPTTVEEFAEKFPPGSNVFIKSLGRTGIVQGHPNSNGEVPVLSQSMRIHVHWKNLSFAAEVEKPQTKKSFVSPTMPSESEPILDLRGKRVDEAIEDLEMALSRAIQNDCPRIKIIHGHGTEALKRAIRTHLSRSPYVKAWKAAPHEAGGDGVTWVDFMSS